MDSRPALYSPTGYGVHEGEAVVRTPHGVKTLQGAAVEPIVDLLSGMDAETTTRELLEEVGGATTEHIDLLYEHGLAYDARAIPDSLQDADGGRFVEPLLPAIPAEQQQDLPDRLASLTVVTVGEQKLISEVSARLQAAGVAVTTDPSEADVIVLSELLERSPSWTEANEQWLDSNATFVKTRLTETGWRLGPVLTPAATACLDCVYSRIDANRAGGRLFTESVTGEPPHRQAYTDTVTELLFRALLGQVPGYLDEQFVVYDYSEQTIQTPRVFALPNCEVCDGV